MQLVKTSEKVLIWLHRTGITQISIAKESGISRQVLANQLKDNNISNQVLNTCKRLGFKE